MKSILRLFTILAFFHAALLAPAPGADRDVVFQVATIQSLSAGVYDGLFSFAALGEHGDFGIGTLNALDGEMVCLDNAFYQVKSDGTVRKIPGSALTPFAMVTFFDEDQRIETVNVDNLAELGRIIDRYRPTRNLFYALCVDGVFDYVKVRSVAAQKKPYRPLAAAVQEQSVFEYKNVPGTLVGFWSPSFAGKINVSGYHFHFISAARDAGGHVLALRFKGLNVRMDRCSALYLVTPENGDYFSANLEGEKNPDLRPVE